MDPQLQEMLLAPKCSVRLSRVKLEPPDAACLHEQGQIQEQYCSESPLRSDSYGVTAGTCDIKEEPREESSKEHAIVEVKTEPYNVAILTGPDHIVHSCDSTSEGMTAGICDVKEDRQEDTSNEHPIIEVKTEPYDVAVLTEQDQMGHNCGSRSEGKYKMVEEI
ncbi:uncharacterized protein LOC135371375 [Ornithodoros turicata]|uniref:uncharacterized protein LOC135371375 n=1 Tax=Ornithodoros turicata TaxID=34597 RepID=UPI00313A13A9